MAELLALCQIVTGAVCLVLAVTELARPRRRWMLSVTSAAGYKRRQVIVADGELFLIVRVAGNTLHVRPYKGLTKWRRDAAAYLRCWYYSAAGFVLYSWREGRGR